MPLIAGFLTDILTMVGRRYQKRGKLSGVMKVGTSLSHVQVQQLHNFFGIEPIRINTKDEVRVNFDIMLKNAPEPVWIERICSHLGYSLKPINHTKTEEIAKTLFSRLHIAFPNLDKLLRHLQNFPDDLNRMLSNNSEQELTNSCFQVAETLVFLLNNNSPITISELGARFFENSKKLRQGELRSLLLRWLNLYCPDLDIVEDEEQIWTNYHVYHDRLTVNAVIYGPIVYTKNGKEFDWILTLYQQGEAATVSWANLQGIETMRWQGCEASPPALICCENEAPFSQLIRRRASDAILFTSGFPGSAVRKIYELLAPQASSCFHWGDTDPNGLRIAAILNSIYSLQLYRCNVEVLQCHRDRLLPLTVKQKQTAEAILLNNQRFPFTNELAFTLENGWLEQESWQYDL
jgi:hypothetical protein